MNDTLTKNVSRWKQLAQGIGLLTVLISCFVAYQLGAAANPGAEEMLYVPEAALNFGTVPEDSQFHWVLPIQNRSRQDVEILDFVSSCSCLSIQPRHVWIRAGRSAEVELTMDLNDTTNQQNDLAVRDFKVEVLPQLGLGLPSQKGFTVRGRLRPIVIAKEARP